MKRSVLLLGVLASTMTATVFPAEPDPDSARPIGMKHFHPLRASLEGLRERGLEPTGIEPIYPKDADCPRADSFFASRTRGDGSYRNNRFNHGYHAGLDIPAPAGTPILAMADGMVVAKKEDSSDGIGGIGIVIQHAPPDTGLPVWLYSRYKHLKEMPALAIGERVKRGQRIAETGATGTTGGYYKGAGHAHLHLDTFISPDDRYVAGEILFFPPNGQMADPLAVYRGAPIDTASVRALPKEAKVAVIPCLIEGGTAPAGKDRLIWPYACRPVKTTPPGN